MTKIRLTLALLAVCIYAVGCAGLPENYRENALQQLTAVYADPDIDPSADALEELLNHPDFTKGEIVFLEIAALKSAEASSAYNVFLDVLGPEIKQAGGELLQIYDILSPGIGDLDKYNYDFFLKEMEDLQKEGKVEVQLIAGKLYFQAK